MGIRGDGGLELMKIINGTISVGLTGRLAFESECGEEG